MEHGPYTLKTEEPLNTKLKLMFLNHHGLPEKHMKRACEWYCYMKSANPDPTRILKEHDQQPGRTLKTQRARHTPAVSGDRHRRKQIPHPHMPPERPWIKV